MTRMISAVLTIFFPAEFPITQFNKEVFAAGLSYRSIVVGGGSAVH